MIPGTFPMAGTTFPIEDAAITFIQRTSSSAATSHTVSSVDFGDTAKGSNQKWIVCFLEFTGVSSPNVVTSNVVIGGETGAVLYSATVTTATTLRVQHDAIAARVDDVTTGNISFSLNKSYAVAHIVALRVINLDCSAVTDSDQDGGAGKANLSIDCPAGGGIAGMGEYGYGGGGTPSSLDYANLTTLSSSTASVGYSTAAAIFSTTQTALDVSFDPVPNSAQCAAAAIAFAYAL